MTGRENTAKSARGVALAALIALVVCLGALLAPQPAQAATFDNSWTELNGSNVADGGRIIAKSGKYYLTEDKQFSSRMMVNTDSVVIDLNGHTITFTGSSDCCIRVTNGRSVTLQDSAGGGTITGGTGYILEGSHCGGGVYVGKNATFNMTGGTIKDCRAGLGGGVYVGENATFNMTGGTITGCSAIRGGGVYVWRGTFNMSSSSSSTISGCSTSTGDGAAVCAAFGTFRMGIGALITNNTVGSEGPTFAAGSVSLRNATMYANGGTINGDTGLNASSIDRESGLSSWYTTYTTFNGTANGGTITQAAQVPVTFSGNGGTPTTQTLYALNGQKLSSRPTTPTRSGYVFTGWWRNALGYSTFDFNDSIVASLFGNVVEAQWTQSIADATVTLDQSTFTYDGKSHKPKVTVAFPSGAGTLKEGTDYTLSGTTSATDADTYTITINGKGDLVGTSKTVRWTIAKANQTVSAQDVSVTYGDTTAKVSATGYGTIGYTVTSGTDIVSVDSATGALTLKKAGTATVQVQANGDTNHYGADKTIKVTVNKASATGSVTAASGLTYNGRAQALVKPGSVTGGTLEYSLDAGSSKTWSSTVPTGTNAGPYTVYYRVKGDENHNDSGVNSVRATIAQATPNVTQWPTIPQTYVGDRIATTGLSGGTASFGGVSADGTFAVTSSTTSWSTADTHHVTVTFTPNDYTNYKTVTNSNVEVTVVKRTVESVLTPIYAITDAYYGTPLGELGLPDKVDITASGGKTFNDVPVTWDAGSYDSTKLTQQAVTGTLDLSAISNEVEQPSTPVTATNSVTLRQLSTAAPVYPAKTAIYTGSPIAHEVVKPTGVSSITYTYEGTNGTTYSQTSTAPTNAGTYQVTATFTMDSSHSKLADITSTLTIDKANPSVTWPTIDGIRINDTLSNDNLKNGSATPNGTFSITGSTKSWTSAGEQSVEVTFTPSDATNYNVEKRDIPVNVLKLTATAPTLDPKTVTYTGQAISHEIALLLPGVSSISYTYEGTDGTSYGPTPTAPTNAGAYKVTVTFTMTESYNQLSPVESKLTINKAAQTVTADDVTLAFGEAGRYVVATGEVGAVSYAVTDGADVVEVNSSTGELTTKKVGTAKVKVTAAGDDNHEPATKEVSVTVNKADQALSASAVALTYGDTSTPIAVTGATGGLSYAVTSGDDVITVGSDGSITALKAGDATVEVTAAGDDNHNEARIAVAVTVSRATPTVSTWPNLGQLYVGDAFDTSRLTGMASVAGTFAITGTLSGALGEQDVEVTFLPTESDKYNTVVEGDVKLTILKRTVASVTTVVNITDKDYDTEYAGLGLPATVSIRTADGKAYNNVPVTWDRSAYSKTSLAEQTITGALDLSGIADEVEQPTAPVTATATVKLKAIAVGAQDFPDKVAVYTGQPIDHTISPQEGVESISYTYEGTGGTTYAATDQAPTDAGTYKVTASFTMVQGRAQHPAVTSTLTITKADQAVTADDVTLSYGDTGVRVQAAGEFGALSYAVTDGADVVEIDAESGELTTKKAGEAKVTVTAAGDGNHKAARKVVNVTVEKAVPDVAAWPTVGDVYVGDALADASLKGGSANIAGSFSITGSTKSWDAAGTYEVELTFAPEDSDNYVEAVKDDAEVTVFRRTVASVTTDVSITDKGYGTGFADLGLPATVGIETADGKAFGDIPVAWDAAGYDAASTGEQTVTGTLDLAGIADEVDQATPEVRAIASVTLQKRTVAAPAYPDERAIYTGKPIAHELEGLPAGVTSVSYSYEGTGSTKYGPSAKAPKKVGTYRVTATFEMEEGYEQLAPVTSELVISKATPEVTAWPTVGDVYVGQKLTDADLEGGKANVDGAFSVTGETRSWESAGTYDVEIAFEPDDTANYEPVAGKVTVNVVGRVAPAPEPKTAQAPAFGDKKASYTGGAVSLELSALPAGVTSVSYSYEGTGSTKYGPSAKAPKKVGTYRVTATFEMEEGYEQLAPVSAALSIGRAKVGTLFTKRVGAVTFIYKVTGKKTARLVRVKTSRKVSKIRIPARVSWGTRFKVTAVGKGALAKVRAKKVVVGKNVAKIGARAFKGSTVTTLNVKSGRLTTRARVRNCLKGSKVVKVRALGSHKKRTLAAFRAHAGKAVVGSVIVKKTGRATLTYEVTGAKTARLVKAKSTKCVRELRIPSRVSKWGDLFEVTGIARGALDGVRACRVLLGDEVVAGREVPEGLG